MADRAYNLSKVNVISLSHGTPINEGMSTNYIIGDDSPQVLFLDPVDSTYRVVMPNPANHIGCFFWIDNTSLGAGILQIWEYQQSIQLGELPPNYRASVISDGIAWRFAVLTPTGINTGIGDADTLDGHDSSYFATADHTHDYIVETGAYTAVNGNRLVVPAGIIITLPNNPAPGHVV